MTVSLDPIVIPTPGASPDETEEDRRAREAAERQMALLDGIRAPAPPGAPPSPVEPPPALARQQREAQSVGDAYRQNPPPDRGQRMPSGAVVYPPGGPPPPASAVDAARRQQAAQPAPQPQQQPQPPPTRLWMAPGMRAMGNLDMSTRPAVRNPDGTVSSVRSMSIGTERGETLIPTVSDDGRVMEDEEAIDYYRQTGRHLGIFDTPDAATRYAEELHDREARRTAAGRMLSAPTGGQAPPDPSLDRPSWMTGGAREAVRALESAPTPEAPAAEAPPVDRARLVEMIRARQGQGAPQPQPQSGRDYTGVDVADALASPLRGIGRGLMIAAGRDPGPSQKWGDVARARDRQTDEDTARREREAAGVDLQRERLGMQREQLDSAQADRESRRELEGERNAISRQMQERRAQIAEQRASTAMQIAESRLRALGSEQERAAAERDPSSEVSRAAQSGIRFRLAGLPDDARARFEEVLPSLDSMSYQTIREIVRQPDSVPRDATHRRGGSRGGGGGGGAATEALQDPPQGWNGTPEQWRALSVRDRRMALRSIGTRAQSGGDAEEGVELVPGVRARLADQPAARQMREGLATARASAANLRGLADIAERHGGLGARISPQARAEVTPRLTTARGMVAQLGNTGIINPSEVPAINAALPDPGNLASMTFGTLNDRVRAWQSLLWEKAESQLMANGVDAAGRARVRQWIMGGDLDGGAEAPRRSAPAPVSRPDSVRVRHPDGRTGTIPRANLERARAAGFEEVTGG